MGGLPVFWQMNFEQVQEICSPLVCHQQLPPGSVIPQSEAVRQEIGQIHPIFYQIRYRCISLNILLCCLNASIPISHRLA